MLSFELRGKNPSATLRHSTTSLSGAHLPVPRRRATPDDPPPDYATTAVGGGSFLAHLDNAARMIALTAWITTVWIFTTAIIATFIVGITLLLP